MRWSMAIVCGWMVASIAIAAPAGPEQALPAVRVVYFYSPTCQECADVKPTVDAAGQQDRVEVTRYDITTDAGLDRLLEYDAEYGGKAQSPPKVFLPLTRVVLEGREAIRKNLPAEIERARNADRPAIAASGVTTQSPSHRTRVTFAAVLVAGLIDGINPCAFATMVFLLSMLAYLGRGRREVLIVGLTFVAVVYGVYFLIGCGLLWSIKAASVTAGISRMLSYAIGAVTLLFGLWSFYDAARIARTARVPRNVLSMPRWAKLASHALIRRMLKTRHLVLAAVVLGVGVSVLESFCTGQVYLSITRMLALPGNESRATGYLLLYNALFVLPLLAMVILCAAGVGSDTLGGLLKRHLVLLKVLMGLLFVMLAAIVFWFG